MLTNPFNVNNASSSDVKIELPQRWLQTISLEGVKARMHQLKLQNNFQSFELASGISLSINDMTLDDTTDSKKLIVIKVELGKESFLEINGNLEGMKISIEGVLKTGSVLMIHTKKTNLETSDLVFEEGSTVLTNS